MDNPIIDRQTILSIGPGQLGIERGIEAAGTELRPAAYVEIEAFIIQNLIGLMEKGLVAKAPIFADIKSFRPEGFRNKIHGIIAGYPCQPFSFAGTRQGENDPRHLWPHIERCIVAIRPLWCFFENVEGHLTMGYDTVYKSLRAKGYRVEEGIFSAEEVGAPHVRRRLFILAVEESYWKQTRRWHQLANTHGNRHGTGSEQGSRKTGKIKTETQQRKRSRRNIGNLSEEMGNAQSDNQSGDFLQSKQGNDEVGGPSGDVANACKQRFPERGEQSARQERPAFERSSNEGVPDPKCLDGGEVWQEQKSAGFGATSTEWPAGPGPYQKEWEAPRVLESQLGCTIDGYNFREDLLRMYGNGVVHQTAEKAWKTLWGKHIVPF